MPESPLGAVWARVLDWEILKISGTNFVRVLGILAQTGGIHTGAAKPRGGIFMAVTHLIDSDHNDRAIPAVGDKVRVKARDGVFEVLRVDLDAGTADLVSCIPGRPHPVHSWVPLNLIQTVYDYLPELFRWYVEEAPEPAEGAGG
jgi:hypothetical protein